MREVNGLVRFPFRDLSIGATFRFASEWDFPFDMKTGEAIKISARRYRYLADGMVCRIGSVRAEVVPTEQP